VKNYSLSREERITSKKLFDRIYESGKTIYSKDKKLKVLFLYDPNSEKPGIKIAAAVSKKAGKAVWRNRIKRLIKESYRLNKKIMLPDILRRKWLLYIIFSPYFLKESSNRVILFEEIRIPVVELLNRIKNEF
jgi:ribonuclease P protein component